MKKGRGDYSEWTRTIASQSCHACLTRKSPSVEARGVANLRSIGGPAMVISSVFLQKGGSRWPLLSRLSGNSSSFLGGGGYPFFFLFPFAGLASYGIMVLSNPLLLLRVSGREINQGYRPGRKSNVAIGVVETSAFGKWPL